MLRTRTRSEAAATRVAANLELDRVQYQLLFPEEGDVEPALRHLTADPNPLAAEAARQVLDAIAARRAAAR